MLGGGFGLVVLMVFSPMVAQIARQFGSWEYAVLAVMGLTLISYVSPGSLVRGMMGGVIGLLISSGGFPAGQARSRCSWPARTGR